MAYCLNKKIEDLVPYEPICGDYDIRLDANESYFNFNDELKNKIKDKIDNIDFNRYPDPYCKKLCKCISNFYGIDESLITVGNGLDEMLSLIISSFLQKGDTIVTLSPDFSMYSFYAFMSEMNNIKVNKNDDLTIDVDALIQCLNENKAKMLVFSNPCNPTSLGLCREDVRKIIRSTDALVVLDEAYMDFWDQSLLDEADKYDNLMLLKTASKMLGAAAIRLGFVYANKKLTNALKAVKSPYNVNTVTQEIGTVLFDNKEIKQQEEKTILENRDYLYSKLLKLSKEYKNKMFTYKSCTNFLFVRFNNNGDSRKIFDKLKSHSIIVRNMGEYLRITVGSKEQCDKFLCSFNDILNELYGG